jgi:hypothetical protein
VTVIQRFGGGLNLNIHFHTLLFDGVFCAKGEEGMLDFRLLADGRIVLTLKTTWADGTRQLVFEPLELLEKLAALTPRPRINLVLYHGVLAPHADWGPRVVAYSAPPVEAPVGAGASANGTDDSAAAPGSRHWAWADLMRRDIDVLTSMIACTRKRVSTT